jgi:hypothetical protein
MILLEFGDIFFKTSFMVTGVFEGRWIQGAEDSAVTAYYFT